MRAHNRCRLREVFRRHGGLTIKRPACRVNAMSLSSELKAADAGDAIVYRCLCTGGGTSVSIADLSFGASCLRQLRDISARLWRFSRWVNLSMACRGRSCTASCTSSFVFAFSGHLRLC
jgi:hypothetical protein